MIIYSISYNIDFDVEKDWLEWMKTSLIPQMMKPEIFSDFRILKLLNEMDNGGSTYSFQFEAPSMDILEKYLEHFESDITDQVYSRYQGKFVEFRTILEKV